MKTLYNNKGAKRIHPSPPPPPPPSSTTYLSFLPTALFALASSLTPQDQEVLAYLLDSPKGKEKHKKGQKNHGPQMGCSCFGCYKSFWARWDSSPNRHAIHLIIDAFEENVELKERGRSKGRSRKKKGVKNRDESGSVVEEKENVEKMLKINDGHHDDDDDRYDGYENDDDVKDDEGGGEEGKSSLKRFVNWVFG